jgi:hypothetical protein
MFGRSGSRQRNAMHPQRITFLAIALWAYLADARPPMAEVSGLVSIADGEPFTIIRRDSLWTGSKGVTLVAGDMVETGPGGFLVIEMQGGSLVGIGPSTQVYFLQRADITTLLVLKGWLKADIRAKANSGAMRVVGTRLGIQGQQAVVLLDADELSDGIFDEQGSATLLLRDDAATRTDKETRPNQFFIREDRAAVTLQPHPSAPFVAKMPIAFRDPLPEKPAAKLQKPAEPKLVRNVTYSDIQSWLTTPADWRAGFIGRFRGRLKDPAFFSAMDAHLALHPEWVPILHPPPPRDRPLTGAPAATTSTPH